MDNLPKELYSVIFSKCEPSDVFNLMLVCKVFNDICNKTTVWNELKFDMLEIIKLSDRKKSYKHNYLFREFYKINKMEYNTCKIYRKDLVVDIYVKNDKIIVYMADREIPDSFFQCDMISNLCIDRDCRVDFDSFYLKNLTSLTITDIELCDVPEKISQMTQLEELELSYSNLENLPDEFENLINLKKINLTDNDFYKFPEILCKLTNLEDICLESNNISEVSSKISNLVNLYHLNLYQNWLKILPVEIGFLPKLKTLDIEQNKVKNIQDIDFVNNTDVII